MNKITLILLFFLYNSQSFFGQDKTITLPKTEGFELKYSNRSINPLFSIYINKHKEVYFEHIKLDSLIQLTDTINKYRSKLRSESFAFANFLLHADHALPYSTIDSVKSLMSSVNIKRVFYCTNELGDLTSGIGRRNQASLRYRKIILSGETIPVEINREPPKGIRVVKHPIETMRDELYGLQFDLAKKSLLKFKYKKVDLVNDKHLIIDDEKIELSNDNKIYKEIKDLDFYFLSSDPKMSYNDYIKNLTVIINVLKKYEIDTPSLEISNSLKQILIREKFQL